LLLALGISTCSALGIYGIFRNKIIYGFFKTCNSKIKLPGRFGFWFWGITGSILFIILTIGISISVLYPTNVKILAFVSSLLVMPIEFILVSNQQSDKDVDTIFNYPVEQSESLKSGVSAVVALLLAILLYNIVVLGFSNYVVSQGSTRDLFSYAIVIAFAAAAVPAGIFYIITKLRKMKVSEDESIRKFVDIHPIYVMIFSIGWMLAFSWIKTDAARSFISSVQGGGLVLFSFLLFNMYADTISLVETNYILEYSKKKLMERVVFLKNLDRF
jgi:hypothetical protein